MQVAHTPGSPTAEVAPLLDSIAQHATGPAERTQAWTQLVLDPALSAAAGQPDLALVCLLVTLDRVRGDACVSVDLAEGQLTVVIPQAGSLGDVLAQVRSAPRLPAGPGCVAAEVAWQSRLDGSAALAPDGPVLMFGVRDDGSALVAVYRSPPLQDEAAQGLLRAWAEVLRQASEGGVGMPIGSLSVVSAADRARLLAPSAPWRCAQPWQVVSRFRAMAARFASRPAVAWRDGRLTYAELDAQSARWAASLQSAGVQRGEVVAIGLPRGPLSIVAVLAVLRAGAAYLPVDLDYPADRLAFMLADAQVTRMLVCSGRAGPALPGLTLLDIDQLPEPVAAAPVELAVDGEDLAYVMYTSGSTGVPKGVEIRHRSILRLVCGSDFMSLDADLVMLHAAPLGFDASTLELWGPLLNGGCIAVHPEEVPTGPGLAETIARHGARAAWLTAALFNAVVDDDPRHLQGLEELLIGGEALSVDHVSRFMRAVPGTALINGYGPTECTTFATTHRIDRAALTPARGVPIGRPINQTTLRILNRRGELLPQGFVGELYIGGLGVARGYLRRPELTAERFIADPFSDSAPALGTLYRTGDLVRWLADDTVEFIGRADGQLKIRGFRIETGEIEAVLAGHESVRACTVVGLRDAARGVELVAYVVPKDAALAQDLPVAALREHLGASLPDYMVPAHWMALDALPVTANGKLDRRALPALRRERPAHLQGSYVEPRPGRERSIADVLASLLGIDQVGADDNFFDIGGNSLLALRAVAALGKALGQAVSAPMLFAHPTPAGLLAALDRAQAPVAPRVSRSRPERIERPEREPIAVIGMAGRFPGAASVEQLWNLLIEGRDGITRFTLDTLDPSVPAALRSDPDYVMGRGILEGIETFDASFFGIAPREAEVMDPQHRVFLEIAWECLERAGHAPDRIDVPVGVYAGVYTPSYLHKHVMAHPDAIERVGDFQVMVGNDKDFVATRVAHRLNLKGPAVAVHTACSTSLVAIAQAVDSLRLGRCDMALAGGASITCPPRSGYLYEDGSMLSSDAQTRTFDAASQGTAFNDGAAVVLLKRLSDALADGDTVHALIRGVAVNNDGGGKASFTAPSVEGQAAVVMAAHADAQVDPRSISYVEAHGTATPIGDPVEVEALTRAFRAATSDTGFCHIGSVKSNIGHIITAAGAAGVIKTALALQHERLPGTLHFRAPNPAIDFAGSPFQVVAAETAWPRTGQPRRAGVSAFGVGGTNAHAVMEEAPLRPAPSEPDGPQLLLLSARTPAALDAMARGLATHLAQEPAPNLADVAHTLQVGRSRFAQRLCVVARDVPGAIAALQSPGDPDRVQRQVAARAPDLTWVFPGQGAQYAGMGHALYQREPVFRAAFDACAQALAPLLSFDLRERVFSGDAFSLVATEVTQPATFSLEYSLACYWMSLGVVPSRLIGHSVGEFAAAVIAGVMSLADAAGLVARRGAMMQALPPGSMLSVRMPAGTLQSRLPAGVSLAAENGPMACVVAGPLVLVERLAVELEREGVAVRALQTSHAFHSSMMDPAVEPFEAHVRGVALHAPTLPIISTLTGMTLTDAEATNPHYWACHLRETVRFSPAVLTALAQDRGGAFLEIGPRGTLSTLVRQHGAGGKAPIAVASLSDRVDAELAACQLALGQLWTLGLEPGLSVASPAQDRRRIVLPTYPFERKRCWLDALPASAPVPVAAVPLSAVPVSAAPVAVATAAASASSVSSSPSSTLPPASNTAMQAVSIPPSGGRQSALVSQLRTLFEDVAGMDLSAGDASTGFIELGLDSLTLTQAATAVKRKFAVNVTFRQLMETYRSFDTLAAHLDAALPADVAAPAPAAAAPAAVPSAPVAQTAPVAYPAVAMPPAALMPMPMLTAGNPGLLQQVLAQQMQLMSQQLALLGGGTPMALAAAGAQAGIAPSVEAAPVLAVNGAPAATAAVPAAVPVSSPAPAPAAAAAASEEVVKPVTYDVKKAFGAIARIHTLAGDLGERKRARLDAFMARYIERTAKSKAYTVDNRSVLADPRVVNGFRPTTKEITYQIVIERSKGSKLWDLDGNEYVDALNGFGMNFFGWQADFVQDAVRAQLERGYEIGPMSPLAGDVARLICELTGFERAGLCNTGSEAVMAAIRIARTVTGRSTVVLFTGSYHGTFDEVVVRAGRQSRGIPAAPGIMPGMFGDVKVLDYGTPESLAFMREHADDLAAVLVEPVQSRRPDFQPKEYLKEVRAITEKAGTCLIFDEVITGFRSHPGGMQALFDIRADLASYGKVIGGGFPVGVVAGKREYMDALDGGAWQYGDDSIPTVGVTYFAGTFVRHPLALAACKASLEYFKQAGPELQAQLNLSTAAMADELNAFCREVGAPLSIKHFASLWRVSWQEDHPLQDLLFAMMRNRGVHILDNFPCFLTTAHTPEDIAKIKQAFKESLAEMQEGEFLPKRIDASADAVVDASRPPVPNARLGRDKEGRPAWFVPDPQAKGKFVKVTV